MPIVKVLRGGQVTLPAELRQRLDLKEGSELLLTVDRTRGFMLHVLPPPGELDDLLGSLRPTDPVDVTQARRDTHEDMASRFDRETRSPPAAEGSARTEEAAARA